VSLSSFSKRLDDPRHEDTPIATLERLGCFNKECLEFISKFHALFPVVITTNISHFWGYLNSGTALTQLDKEDVVEFFKRQGVEGTRAEIEEVCSAYGFHPLSLRLLSGMVILDMKYGGDVKAWTRHNPLPKLVPKEHHILELAYNSLDEKKQIFISRLSAFRNPMDYEAISIFSDFGGEDKFNEVLIELVDRGMLFRYEKSSKFDLHPIVRKYCYDRLKNKESIHLVLTDYFNYLPMPEKVESMDMDFHTNKLCNANHRFRANLGWLGLLSAFSIVFCLF